MTRLSADEIKQILGQPEVEARELAREFDRSVRRIQQIRMEHGQFSPRFLSPEEQAQIGELRKQGVSQPKIAEAMGRATSTVRLVIARQRIEEI
jgi:DNA-binding NarL/FixJ family response regulator